jgi:hypothetical protein
MKTLLAALLLLPTVAWADGATAYLDGKGYASGTLDSSFGQVSQGNAASLPFYGASAPQQSLFGSASLFGAATGKIGSCVGYTPDPGNPTSNQECSAVNFLAKNPTQRVRFNLDPNTDPSVLAAGGVQNNAQVLSGVGNGTIGNCGTTTVTQGGQTSIEVCNQYNSLTSDACNKFLNVSVSQTKSCSPGTYYNQSNWYLGMDGIVGAAYCEFRADSKVVIAFDARGGQGSCTPGGWVRAPLNPGEGFYQTVQPHWHGSCTTYKMAGKLNWCSGDTCQATVGAAGPASCPSGQINGAYSGGVFWGGGAYALGDCYRDGFSWMCTPNGQYADPTMCYKSSATGLNFIEVSCSGEGCSYNYKGTYTLVGPGTPTIATPSVTFQFLRPHLDTTTTKTWDNQCSILEARAK